MSDATDLQALCVELLAAAVDALDTVPLADSALLGAPERRYVSPGQPALDCCDELSVYASAIGEYADPRLPSSGRRIAAHISLITLIITASRCVHVMQEDGDPPLAGDLERDAAQINADGWALWNHLYNLWRSGLLFTLCGEVFWDGLRALAPSGGCAGWQFVIRASLNGYEDVASS